MANKQPSTIASMFGADARSDELPCHPQTAFFVGCLFLKLGGSFTIGSNGQRYVGRPTPALYRLNGEGLPQIPRTEPHEQFHSDDEWGGAIKLLDALIRQMDKDDRDFLFEVFAPTAIDDRKLTPSIEEPRRGAA